MEECAADPSHQPAIYAAFIREIVRKTKEAKRGPSVAPSRMGSPIPIPNPNAAGSVANGETHVQSFSNSLRAGLAAQAQAGEMAIGSGGDQVYDPQLMDQTANWQPGDLLPGGESAQFSFIPQGGDMMCVMF